MPLRCKGQEKNSAKSKITQALFPPRRNIAGQPLAKTRKAPLCLVIANSHMQGPGLANQNDQLLAARYGRINQVALQKHIMLHHYGDDNRRVFRTLRFVNADGVCRGQLVKLVKFVRHDSPVKINAQKPVRQIQMAYPPHVAVKNILFIIVAHLHDLVMQPKGPVALAHLPLLGIQDILQAGVHLLRANCALVHGRKHLHIVDAVQPETPRNMVAHKIDNQLGRLFRL